MRGDEVASGNEQDPWVSGGIGAAIVAVCAALLRFLEGRYLASDRAQNGLKEEAKHWQNELTKELRGRIEHLEMEVERCHKEKSDLVRRVENLERKTTQKQQETERKT